MKTNQFRAMMLVLLMAVISLGRMNAQVITVSGTVTDAKDGNPLVGCSVQIKGTSKGAITNMKGRYTIQAKKGETLLFQYIGYKQERRVVKSATLDVKMKADDVVLEECVAVGYGHELKLLNRCLLLIWRFVRHRESCMMLQMRKNTESFRRTASRVCRMLRFLLSLLM